MQTLHPIHCHLIVTARKKRYISSRQFPAIARDFSTSPSRVQRSIDALVEAELLREIKPCQQ